MKAGQQEESAVVDTEMGRAVALAGDLGLRLRLRNMLWILFQVVLLTVEV